MWLVAGLGNPGEDYEDTRHNAGFMVIDILSNRFSISLRQRTADYALGRGSLEDCSAVLLKPLTFMNRSGRSVRDVISRYEGIENILIVHDDLDLEAGVVRIRKSGSSGGHNGVQSVIDSLGSQDFIRVKVGIGRPEREPAERYVLRRFTRQEWPVMEEALERAADAVVEVITRGVASAQNKFH